MYHERTGIPEDLKRFAFAGRILGNEKRLDYYDVSKESSILFMSLLRG
jgi:hypothetical protein